MQSPELQALIEYLKENLEVRVKSHTVYTGGDPLYENVNSIQLVLEDEVISETYNF